MTSELKKNMIIVCFSPFCFQRTPPSNIPSPAPHWNAHKSTEKSCQIVFLSPPRSLMCRLQLMASCPSRQQGVRAPKLKHQSLRFSHLTCVELLAGSSVWMVEIFSPIPSSERSPCSELEAPFSAEACSEEFPSSGFRKASRLWGLMNCTLRRGATVAPLCWLGFRMQRERVETQVFLKFSFMKAYTMGLLKLLKKPTAWTMAMIMLRVTPSYFFSKSSGGFHTNRRWLNVHRNTPEHEWETSRRTHCTQTACEPYGMVPSRW